MIKKVIVLFGLCCYSLIYAVDVDNYFNQLKTYQANFIQVVTQEGSTIQQSMGKVVLKKPFLFKWDYLEPEAMQLISDGKNFIHYDLELNQATVKPVEEVTSSPLMLLMNEDKKPSDLFEIVSFSDQNRFGDLLGDKAKSLFLLVPKEDLQVSVDQIVLGFDQNDDLSLFYVEDELGVTVFYFEYPVMNLIIDDALFDFKAQEGVDILGELIP